MSVMCRFKAPGAPRVTTQAPLKRHTLGGDPKTGGNCLGVPGGICWKFLGLTLPESSIAPENGWFPIGISSSRGPFSGAMLVLGGVGAFFFCFCFDLKVG